MRVPQRRRRRSAFVAVFAALTIAGCQRTASEPVADVQAIGVTVQLVRRAPLRDVATASGTLVPSAAGEWTVFATEPAQIVALPLKEGDAVNVGDVLVRFEIASLTQEFNARQVAVVDATARADRARAEFARMSQLFERGIASRNAYEAARAEQTTSGSVLGQAVAQLEQTKLDQMRATVHARFPGIVARVWHAEGDFVSGSGDDRVIQVVDPTRLQVAVQLPIPQLARIAPGQAASVLAIGADAPLVATVATKPSTTDPNAPTGEVRLAFVEPTVLPADTPVSVEILLDQRAEATVIPADALRRDAASSYVIVAGDDGLAHRRDVRTGLVTQTLAEIVSGLEPGERVVVGGLDDVADGTPIVFRE